MNTCALYVSALRSISSRVIGGRRDVAAGRIADQARHIADEEDHRVAEILEVLHLPEQNCVAQMQIGRGRVETGLHAQGPPER